MPKNGNGDVPVARSAGKNWTLFKKESDAALAIVRENFEGSGLTPFDLDRVKIPAGGQSVWLVDTVQGQEAVEELEGVVILAHDTRAWWRCSDVTGSPPDCFSPDCIQGRGARDDSEYENSLHECSSCHLSGWGTGKKGRGQACGVKKRVFMLMKDSVNPIPTALFLPATSLKGARKYFLRLLQGGVNYWDVVTKWRLEPDKDPDGNPYSRAVPSSGGALSKKGAEWIAGIREVLTPILRAAPLEEWEKGDSE